MKKCVCEKASVDMFSLQPLDPLSDILLTVVSKLCKLGSRATYTTKAGIPLVFLSLYLLQILLLYFY